MSGVTFTRYYYREGNATTSASFGEEAGDTFAEAVLALNPVIYWRMGEASGNLTDSSGNGHTGVANGSPTYGQTGFTDTADGNDAIGFAANADFDVADHADFDMGAGDFTLIFAMKHASGWPSTAHECILGHSGAGVKGDVRVILRSNIEDRVQMSLIDATTGWVDANFDTAANSLDDGNWHLCVITADRSGDAILYVDGTALDTGAEYTEDISPAASYDLSSLFDFQVGATNSSGNLQYNGDLDEIAIIKGSALSQSQVQALWDARDVT